MILAPDDCTAAGGVFQGYGVPCDPNPLPAHPDEGDDVGRSEERLQIGWSTCTLAAGHISIQRVVCPRSLMTTPSIPASGPERAKFHRNRTSRTTRPCRLPQAQ